MDKVTEQFGELLKIPESSARYLLALFIGYLFAIVYRLLLKRASATVQSVYFTATGIWTLYFVFGFSIWHFVLDIIAVYIFLLTLGPTLITLTLTWILTMGHLLYGYYIVTVSNQVHPIFWTIPHCVLVLKLIGLVYNLIDGKKKQESLTQEQRLTALNSIPSFVNIVGFCFHFCTVLAGPQFSFKRYQDFVSGQLFDWRKTSGSFSSGVQRMFLGILMSLLYSYLNSQFQLEYVISDQFNDHTFLVKMFYVVLISNLALRRYIAVWLLAEGACIITGVSYSGKLSNTYIDDWSGINNVQLLKFELSTSLQDVIDSFNVNTNYWVKCYIFKRMKWINNKNASSLVSLLFLSFWHGIWIGYLLNFSLEFVYVKIEQQFKSVLTKRLDTLWKQSWIFHIVSLIIAYVLKSVLLSYPVLLFALLSWESCFKFMSSVYFFGHITPVVWLLMYTLFLRPSKTHKNL